MSVSIIVGSQWGDEGKAKAIDYLAERSDIIVRFQGGANAGHTVMVGNDKFIFHLVPSGIMYPDKTCVVSNGVVFDPEQFLKEVDDLIARGISMEGRLFVSDLAHIVLPYHKSQDQFSESQAAERKIGTTGRGIGPAYTDKAARTGIRVGDIVRWDSFTSKLKANWKQKQIISKALFGQGLASEPEQLIEQYRTIRERLLPFITNTSEILFSALKSGKKILCEGAQGTFLDIDHGTYPFVTSSNTIAGAVCTGAGIGPTAVTNVTGIVKAYTTRVGNGPFPTELTDETGEFLRKEGGEFGATTGRPRRCGWFDSVLLRKAVQLNGMTHIALTKIDVLNKLDEIKICTHYIVNGKKQDFFPSIITENDSIEPVYETIQGWKTDISGCRKMSELPQKARAYIDRLQSLCYGIPALIVSVGPKRDQTIAVDAGA
jgi:adenylosuccinate synthase